MGLYVRAMPLSLVGMLLAVSTALATDPAQLDDMSLEELMQVEVVQGASRLAQSASTAPSAVTIVTQEEIRALGYRTLAEVLNGARGFYTTYDYSYSFVGVRGFSRPGDWNTRVLMLIDGARVNDPFYSQAYVGEEGFLDLELIKRIEIIRGPSSSLYGSNAFFATINIITRDASDLPGLELAVEAGAASFGSARVSYGRAVRERGSLLVSGSWMSRGGRDIYFPEFDHRATNDGWSRDADDSRSVDLFLKAERGDFRFEAGHSKHIKEDPAATYGTTFGPRHARNADQFSFANLGWKRGIGDRVVIDSRMFGERYRFDGFYPYRPSSEDATDLNDGRRWGLESVLTARFDRIQFAASVEYIDAVKLLYVETLRDGSRPIDANLPEVYYAASAEVTAQATKRWSLDVGFRYDQHVSLGSIVSPRLGFIFALDDSTTLKLLAGRSFRAPNPYERITTVSGLGLELKPEQIDAYEVTYDRQYSARGLINLSAYRYALEDLIEVDGLTGKFVNTVGIRAHGFEFEWRHQLDARDSIRASLAWQKTDDAQLSSSPHWLGKAAWIASWDNGKLRTGTELTYVGGQYAALGRQLSACARLRGTIELPSALRHASLALIVDNITDSGCDTPASSDKVMDRLELPGRSWRLKLTYPLR